MLRFYFNDLCSRPSCYQCHFKTINRVSDITIFDCWDAPSVSPQFSGSGATNVFLHTPHGHEIFEQIKDDFVWVNSNIDEIIKRDGVMIKHFVKPNPKRSEFFKDLNVLPFAEMEYKYLNCSLKCRIITYIKPLMYRLGIFSLYMKVKKRILS